MVKQELEVLRISLTFMYKLAVKQNNEFSREDQRTEDSHDSRYKNIPRFARAN